MGATGCPTPIKKGYRSKEAAERHMWSVLQRRNDRRSWCRLKVYRCNCGLYHVGHGRGAA